MYHSISDRRALVKSDLWSLNSKIFSSHLHFLINSKINILNANDLISNIPKEGVVITFDDGLKDNFDIAAPILIEMKIPFTIFIVPSFLKPSFSNYMSAENLKDLAKSPLVTIGSHSLSHRVLSECDQLTQKKEIFESKDIIEDLIGKPIDMFAYPHGVFNGNIRSLVVDAGYKVAFTSVNSFNPPYQDKLLIKRNEIWNSDTVSSLDRKLKGDWDWLRYKKNLK
jgi:peptidoglycan/xylan/chitin deacetylase (PgdA/CDA1 family)